MKIFIGILLIVYANIAMAQTAQTRCVKWTWYNVGSTQKSVCLQWAKR